LDSKRASGPHVHPAGLLFPPGDSHALAACLKELLHDSHLHARLAAAGAERMRTEFTLARAVHRMGEIYAQVLRERLAAV
jgi:hypothetical protein